MRRGAPPGYEVRRLVRVGFRRGATGRFLRCDLCKASDLGNE